MPLGEAEEHIGRPLAVSGAETQDVTYGRQEPDDLSVPTSTGEYFGGLAESSRQPQKEAFFSRQ